ncbi:PadR family transcriptional regulator [Methanofollis formosanus]|uniref:PadR family transcriptional regulator n=2 Tax=Methanofollis TaxID=81416 RepID=A0A8G0ZYU0_9EURY|nr:MULTISPECIES: PadR family transcriptional regulator [Methanofollis]QSZ66379.1 PadR family transcriptional regulator [Methanofollis aquaemaris]QYZ78140.1 PadR family transcriptional regulator [Methanofollis formosanus]
MNVQFKKGVLDLCVLSLLSRRACYGYEIVQEISETVEISEGTIYPLLRRLKKEGHLETYIRESTGGPPRKYYRLTESGSAFEHRLREEWFSFVGEVNRFLGDEDERTFE